MDKSQQSEGKQQQCPNDKFQSKKARFAEMDEKSKNDKIERNASSIQRTKLSSNLKPFQSFIDVNDVKFIMSDGEAVGNSIILSSGMDCITKMLANKEFEGGLTKEISMKEDGSKTAMDIVINYVYSGEGPELQIDLTYQGPLKFPVLLEVMNIARKLLIKDGQKLFRRIEQFMKMAIGSHDERSDIRDLIQVYALVDKFRLDNLEFKIINQIYNEIHGFLPCKDHGDEEFKQYTVKMVKMIMLHQHVPMMIPEWSRRKGDLSRWPGPRFAWFAAWYAENKSKCLEEPGDMVEIITSFRLDQFSGEELLTVVKKSGIFSDEAVNNAAVEKFKKCSYGKCKE